MAKVNDNILLQVITGTIGNMITIYVRNGVVIMAKKRGPSKEPPSGKQLTARLKMKLAVAIAKQMMKDPDLKAFYAKQAGPGQNAFNMAVKAAYQLKEVVEVTPQKATVPSRKKGRTAVIPDDNTLLLLKDTPHQLSQFREFS